MYFRRGTCVKFEDNLGHPQPEERKSSPHTPIHNDLRYVKCAHLLEAEAPRFKGHRWPFGNSPQTGKSKNNAVSSIRHLDNRDESVTRPTNRIRSERGPKRGKAANL